MKILRSIAAIVIGAVVAVLAISATETVNAVIYAPSPDKPLLERMKEMQEMAEDCDAMKAWIESLPLSAMAILQVAWALGAFIGGGVAAAIAGRGRLLHAGIIGAFILAATVVNFLQMKEKLGYTHPDWLIITGLLLPLPMSLLAGKLVAIVFPPQPASPS